MTWKDTLKAHCGTEKTLYGKQKKLDRNKNNKIDAEDFAMLRDTEKKADVGSTIVETLQEEGGAAGFDALMKPLDMPKEELETILEEMENVVQHKDGDYILLDGLPLPEKEEEEEEEEEEEDDED